MECGMNWVRIARGIKTDPAMHVLAAQLGVSPAECIGLLVGVYVELPDHAKDGDITAIPDALLEYWAVWRGAAGQFATAFRAQMCDDGTVRGWDKHNGAAIREAEANRERQKARRAANVDGASKRDTSNTHTLDGTPYGMAYGTPDRTEVSPVPYAGPSGATNVRTYERTNGTALEEQLPADAPASAPARVAPKAPRLPASAPKYPHYPDADCAALYEAWRAKVGAIAYPEFRKATAPLFTAAGPYAPVDELVRCIGDTAALESSRGRVAFLTPRSWVGGIAEHIRVTRLDADAKMRLLDEAERRGGRR